MNCPYLVCCLTWSPVVLIFSVFELLFFLSFFLSFFFRCRLQLIRCMSSECLNRSSLLGSDNVFLCADQSTCYSDGGEGLERRLRGGGRRLGSSASVTIERTTLVVVRFWERKGSGAADRWYVWLLGPAGRVAASGCRPLQRRCETPIPILSMKTRITTSQKTQHTKFHHHE